MDKIKITFLKARAVLDHNGEIEAEFEKGKDYTLPVTSADRWIRRGIAVIAVIADRKRGRPKK